MARVVESVASEMEGLIVEIVVTKTMKGALRYQELVKTTGSLLPVPSILINEELAFKTTPGVEELKLYLDKVKSGK